VDGKIQYQNIALYAGIGIGCYILIESLRSPNETPLLKFSPTDFIKKYYPFALAAQKRTGVPFAVALAEAGIESAWGKKAIGNNLFGIKASKGWKGETQNVPTTEYGKTGNPLKDSVKDHVLKVIPPTPPQKLYKYRVIGLFRKYATPEQSFVDYGNFLRSNARYKNAFRYTNDPHKFIQEIAKAGYATGPNYAETVGIIINQINRYLKTA
jgi:flagellum-specific peptidoglycan hydrolase FlgJ